MTRQTTTPGPEFTVDRERHGDDWRVDDDGNVHTGTAAAHADRVIVTCTSER